MTKDYSTLAADSGIIERFLIKIFVENVIQMGNKFQNEIDTIRISKKKREMKIPFVSFVYFFSIYSIRISIYSYLQKEDEQKREEDPTRNGVILFCVHLVENGFRCHCYK